MTHEELVRLVEIFAGTTTTCSRGILALIAERLKEPTEKMINAGLDENDIRHRIWTAMLAASPLLPDKT